MKVLRDALASIQVPAFEALETRQFLDGDPALPVGDIAISDVMCDAKVSWLVPGDKFNIVAELYNASFAAATKGKINLSVFATDGVEEYFVGTKTNVSFNLGAATDSLNGPVYKKLKVPVSVTLDIGFVPGNYTFLVRTEAVDSFDDASFENNELSTDQTLRQASYEWEFAYRLGTHAATSQLIPGDTRAFLRRGVKMTGTISEALTRNGVDQFDANGLIMVSKKLSASLTGSGSAEFVFEGFSPELNFIGTDNTSVFSATVSGGRSGYDRFNQIDFVGMVVSVSAVPGQTTVAALKSFKAPGFNFVDGASLMFENGLSDFTCGNLIDSSFLVGTEDQPTPAILGAFTANAMAGADVFVYPPLGATAGLKFSVKTSVVDSELRVEDGRIASATVGSWSGGSVRAAIVGTIDSAGLFDCDIVTTGVNRNLMDQRNVNAPFGPEDRPILNLTSLTRLTVKGRTAGTWDLDGNVGAITIGQVDASPSGAGPLLISVAGRLDKFTSAAAVGGEALDGSYALGLYAFSINSVALNASVAFVDIQSGFALPSEDTPWVPESALDPLAKIGFIGNFVAKGDVLDSKVYAGFDPIDERLEPGAFRTGEMKKIAISGAIGGDTAFRAAALPISVKVKVQGWGTTANSVFTNPVRGLFADLNFQDGVNGKPWFATSL